ncbi:hypothetical protein EYZ11_007029 [Aspergillus tanneri]|uniref:Beta-glucosidase 1B n=1 Tax=Aspergillus tanneri TaxID=1220188 RepID=A0A4S3JEI6_9EURO|nr:hypothetical protein EYZ11_007029 [Aspergillus tanneri]
MAPAKLPSNFEWGFATAAYQIEGAVDEDGRGKSIWDTFCHLEPSRTKNATGDVACDHYHRYEEDFDLPSKYGSKAYRFSISWSRIIPLGGRYDPINEAGVAFYNRLIDSLLARGITPWRDFERYARVCFERFGDRVRNWITLNEPWIAAIFGYATGVNAPGRGSIAPGITEGHTPTEPWIVGKSLIMSHARAVVVYKRDFHPVQKGQIGFGPGLPAVYARAAAQSPAKVSFFRDATPKEATVDFYGMNYYTAQFCRHRTTPAPENDFLGNVDELQENCEGVSIGEKSGVSWLRSCPKQFQKHLALIYHLYQKPIYITENGCPCPGEDLMTREESVQDIYRIQ